MARLASGLGARSPGSVRAPRPLPPREPGRSSASSPPFGGSWRPDVGSGLAPSMCPRVSGRPWLPMRAPS
eukprot:8670522-Alexandrium_andersonii.AAC.1